MTDSWSDHFQKYLKGKIRYYETRYSKKAKGEKEEENTILINNADSTDSGRTNDESRNNNIKKKKKKFLDLTPGNLDVADYCKSLLNARFHGEVEYDDDGREIQQLIPPTIEVCMSLADTLKGLDEVVRSVDDDFTGFEEEFIYYIRVSEYLRNMSEQEEETLLQQSKRFIKVYKRRGVVSQYLGHDDFWATRQQLLAGKVIADWVDPACGPMDPIFGVLLNPTAGRTGPGDSGFVHRLLFDNDGPMAYHSAVHDGFGYLITNHNIGPGYDYLGAWSLFDSATSLSGQLSGISFWKKVLKETEDVKVEDLIL